MGDTPLHFKTLTGVASLVESRQLSPVEMAEALLKRIEGTAVTRAPLR